MASSEKLISVVIPAYNSSIFIRETVESALTQIAPHFRVEAIVTDDGSVDQTAAIARAAGAFVVRKENGGISSSRNAGLRLARGEYILFLDGDDRLRPGALAVLFDALKTDPNRGAVFAMAQDFISPELPAEEKALLRPRKAPYFGLLTGCMLIRRKAVEQVGLFDEGRRTGEAVEWLLRMRDRNIETVRTHYVSADRRLHMTNTGRLHRMQERRDYASVLRERLKANI
jgi:glycosyltransferase involved in cell wall biosynthesis